MIPLPVAKCIHTTCWWQLEVSLYAEPTMDHDRPTINSINPLILIKQFAQDLGAPPRWCKSVCVCTYLYVNIHMIYIYIYISYDIICIHGISLVGGLNNHKLGLGALYPTPLRSLQRFFLELCQRHLYTLQQYVTIY